jgi:hypothetical protein
MAGCAAIGSATSVVLSRAQLQSHADAIALAHVTRGDQAARFLADTLGVTINTVTTSETVPTTVSVRISNRWGSAEAEASARDAIAQTPVDSVPAS